MTLWMPMIDFARGYAPLVRNVATLMGHPACVQVLGLTQAQLAALQHHGKMQVDLQGHMGCDWLVVGMRGSNEFQASAQASGWRYVQHVRRPTDQYENLVLFERRKSEQP
jgi:hypothetical protein